MLFLSSYLVLPPSSFSGLSQIEPQDQAGKEDIQSILDAAYAHYAKKDYRSAVASYERLIKAIGMAREPKTFEEMRIQTYLAMADCYFQLGDSEKTKSTFIEYLKLRPDLGQNPLFTAEGLSVVYGEAKAEFRSMLAAEAEKKRAEGVRGQETEINEGPEKKVTQKPVIKARPEGKHSEEAKGRFPWLIAGGLAVGGAVVVYLLTKKEGGPSTGTIAVSSTPSGARVLLDGVERGTTAMTISDVSIGSHSLQLVKEGYRDFMTTVNVAAGKTETINAVLTKHTIIVSNPNAETVWIKASSVQVRWETGSSISTRILSIDGASDAPLAASRTSEKISAARGEVPSRGIPTSPLGRAFPKRAQEGLDCGDTSGCCRERAQRNLRPSWSNPGLLSRYMRPFVPLMADHDPAGSRTASFAVRALAVTSVRIDLYKSTSIAETIVSNTTNDGTYDLIVPVSILSGSGYRVRVSCVSEPSVYGDSSEFIVQEPSGNLRVESSPTGARVFLDGRDSGKITNCTLTGIPSGPHRIRLEKEGYQGKEGNVSVVAGKTNSYRWTLNKNVISVTSPSSGAVWFGGAENEIKWTVDAENLYDMHSDGVKTSFSQTRDTAISHVSIDLYRSGGRVSSIAQKTANDGSYQWRVPTSLKNYDDYKIRIYCAEDTRIFGESGLFAIETGKSRVQVESDPSGASIFVDGADTKTKTPCSLTVNVGSHVFELKMNRYLTFRKEVTVRSGDNPRIRAELSPAGFLERFDSGANVSKYFVESHPAQWTVESGVYRFVGISGSNVRSTSRYDLGDFQEIQMQADCGVYEFDAFYGLGFRGNKDFSTFWFFYIGTADGRYELVKHSGGNDTYLTSGYNSTIRTGPHQQNKIKIVSKGRDFIFYVNGTEVLRYFISDIPLSGRIGLVSKTCYKKAWFDNLSVETFDDNAPARIQDNE